VADAATTAGGTVHFEADRAGLGRVIASRVRAGDVVLTMGAGDITRVGPELVGLLQQR
jgi:UDP-N-acetylmuramate--alanine ligase